jgi:uncharacterized protein (TIGR03790 family)
MARALVVLAAGFTGTASAASADSPRSALDAGPGLRPADIGIVANSAEPLSMAIADYYQWRRGIPARNVVRVNLGRDVDVLSAGDFARIKALVDRELPSSVQALVLTWTRPYRVDCMSITSAFAFGFDPRACADGCRPTLPSPYYDSASRRPWQELGMRPAMSLAARDLPQAKALIERGLRADRSAPRGTAYLLDTADSARNARAGGYSLARGAAGARFHVEIVKGDYLQHRRDVLLYETGVANVPELTTNRFLPGAIADHLTSFGGQLFGKSQMSSLRWLEAGATGSYGTVLEPCAFTGKFPNPAILLKHYLAGETLIESYWKSVAMPGQGLFIGEPLANPYGGMR